MLIRAAVWLMSLKTQCVLEKHFSYYCTYLHFLNLFICVSNTKYMDKSRDYEVYIWFVEFFLYQESFLQLYLCNLQNRYHCIFIMSNIVLFKVISCPNKVQMVILERRGYVFKLTRARFLSVSDLTCVYETHGPLCWRSVQGNLTIGLVVSSL